MNLGNSRAFRHFFDEPIVVEGERPCLDTAQGASPSARSVKGTFLACVFDNGLSSPFADSDVDTDVRTFSISVRARDWIERTPPQLGDRISLDSNGISFKLAVSRVESLLGDIWTVTAKEVAK